MRFLASMAWKGDLRRALGSTISWRLLRGMPVVVRSLPLTWSSLDFSDRRRFLFSKILKRERRSRVVVLGL